MQSCLLLPILLPLPLPLPLPLLMPLTQMRAQLASVALPVRLVAGHNLFEEGDAADSFYVLQEGETGSACICSVSRGEPCSCCARSSRWRLLPSEDLPRPPTPLPAPVASPAHQQHLCTAPPSRPCAGEAINLRGARVVGHLHGPALVGQAAVFSHYVEECRSRLHTGTQACRAAGLLLPPPPPLLLLGHCCPAWLAALPTCAAELAPQPTH